MKRLLICASSLTLLKGEFRHVTGAFDAPRLLPFLPPDLSILPCRYGIADWLQFDASVVRGLAYYTGTVFEVWRLAKDRRWLGRNHAETLMLACLSAS